MRADPGFRLHPGAVDDIVEIWEFIATSNPAAAARVRADLLEAMRKLVDFPHRGHLRPDLTSRPLRFKTVRSYLIAYTSDGGPPVVLAVLDGRRNPRTIAAMLGRRV